jgi:hypothetical protein
MCPILERPSSFHNRLVTICTVYEGCVEEGTRRSRAASHRERANTNAQDISPCPPLHWASGEGKLEVLRLLLELEADVHTRSSLNETPFQQSVDSVAIAIGAQCYEVKIFISRDSMTNSDSERC